jgi:hypothetical protein
MISVGEMVSDIERCAVLDTTEIRTSVPRFAGRLTFDRAAGRKGAFVAYTPTAFDGTA